MLVSKISDLNVVDYRQAFPNSSFTSSGPSDDFLAANGYARVNLFKEHNRATQKLVQSAPYYEAPWVYTVQVKDKSTEELQQEQEAFVAELQKTIVSSTQARLDAFAATRGYDGVNSIAKYKDISDEEISMLEPAEQLLVNKFRAEARYLAVKTAQTWAKLYIILEEVKQGTRPIPSGFSDIELDLPELNWPV